MLPDLSLESDLIKEGAPFKYRLTLLGDIYYHSVYNKRMKGVITVVKPKASAPIVARPSQFGIQSKAVASVVTTSLDRL
jgi:hypothetical protein